MSDLLSATLAPVRVTEATKSSVSAIAQGLGVSEADVVRLSLRHWLNCDAALLAEVRPSRLGTPAGDA